MQLLARIIPRLAVAFLTFKIGVMLYSVLFGYGMAYLTPIEESRLRRPEDMAQTVFRYEIEHFTPGAERSIYYLSCYNDSDPEATTMEEMASDMLPVRRLSEIRLYPNSGCYYCPDGKIEFILRVGSVRWLNDDEVLVGGSLRRWVGDVDQAFLFHVVRRDGSWVVKDHELL